MKDAISLTLCMIVKDEEVYLPACLRSVKGLVDEMVVLDTGSTDRTREVARSYGAEIHCFHWNDDFSEARNASLKPATGKWILVLDADEVIASIDRGKIRNLLKGDVACGFTLEQRTYGNNPSFRNWMPAYGEYPEERGYGGYVASQLIRLFRNDPKIRFEGPVHELVEPGFSRLGLPVRNTAVPIHHYGKVREPLRIEKKARLYLEIGKRKAAADPGSAKAQSELGAQYLELKDYKNAAEAFRNVLRIDPDNADALADLGAAYLREGRLESAKAVLQKALDRFPPHFDALFNLGVVLLRQGSYEAAEKALSRLIDISPDAGNGYGTMGSLLLCCNRIEEAVLHLKKGIRLNSGDADLYSNLAWAELRLSWPQPAAASSRRALELDPEHENALRLRRQAIGESRRKNDPARAADLNRVGEERFKNSDPKGARGFFLAAARVDPFCAEAFNNLGVLHWNDGNRLEALPHFLRAFLIQPSDGNTKANLLASLDCCDLPGKDRLKRLIEDYDAETAENNRFSSEVQVG